MPLFPARRTKPKQADIESIHQKIINYAVSDAPLTDYLAGHGIGGIANFTTHTQPKEGQSGGQDGQVLVLNDNHQDGNPEEYNKCSGIIKNAANELAKAQQKFHYYLLENTSSKDSDLAAAKEKLDEAHKQAIAQLRAFTKTVDHNKRLRIKLWDSDPSNGNHAVQNWDLFTLKYADARGNEQSLKLAVDGLVYQYITMAQRNVTERAIATMESKYSEMMAAAAPFLPDAKSAQKAR